LAGDFPRCEELLRTGAAVDALLASEVAPKGGSVPREGSTALHIAVARKDLGFVTWLLDQGADLNHPDGDGYTPLEVYFETLPGPGPEEIALLLIERGGKVNTCGGIVACGVGGRVGLTPLDLAAERNLLRTARSLLAHGADPNGRGENGSTPIHWASSAEMIDLLVKAGGNLDAKSEGGLTALASATWIGSPETAVALLEAGANPDPAFPEWMAERGSLYHLVISKLEVRNDGAAELSLLRALLKHRADVNRPDELGETPLHSACFRSGKLQEEMALILLAGGADPKLRDDNGDTPLHHAVQANRPRLVQELIRKGADVNSRDNLGDTPLHHACWEFQGDPGVLEALLKAGADIHAKRGDGKEPLDCAREEHRVKIASLLAGH
jgi:cytohesin